jgi:CubicO group peptidase (beta-lactamase class C family)
MLHAMKRVVYRSHNFGSPDRATPSWSMTKAITCTVIGRLIQEGWLASVHDPAPALGFIGLLVSGSMHQPHHLAMAKGEFDHEHLGQGH